MQPEGDVQNVASAPIEASTVAPKANDVKDDIVFRDKPKKNTAMILCLVFLMLLAVGGIGFGVWAMMDGNARADSLNEQIDILKKQNSELSDKIRNDDSDTTEYMYVGEWGIKILKPSIAKALAYEYNDFNDSLVIDLTTQDVDEFNRDLTSGGHVGAESEIILERHPENTKDKESAATDGPAKPVFLFTLNGYDYFGIIGGVIDNIREFYSNSDNYSLI